MDIMNEVATFDDLIGLITNIQAGATQGVCINLFDGTGLND